MKHCALTSRYYLLSRVLLPSPLLLSLKKVVDFPLATKSWSRGVTTLLLRHNCSKSNTELSILVDVSDFGAKPEVRVLSPRVGDRFTTGNVWLSLAVEPTILPYSVCFDIFDIGASISLGW